MSMREALKDRTFSTSLSSVHNKFARPNTLCEQPMVCFFSREESAIGFEANSLTIKVVKLKFIQGSKCFGKSVFKHPKLTPLNISDRPQRICSRPSVVYHSMGCFQALTSRSLSVRVKDGLRPGGDIKPFRKTPSHEHDGADPESISLGAGAGPWACTRIRSQACYHHTFLSSLTCTNPP